MAIVYKYNSQIAPPAPLLNLVVRSPENSELFVQSPALIDTGADISAITTGIQEKLTPLRVGVVYIESFKGEGQAQLLYEVNLEFHQWTLDHIPVIVAANDYVILGRDILNSFDLRLNGIKGRFEILRGP